MLTHGNMTIYTKLLQQAKIYKNKAFLVYEDEETSYEEMSKRVNRCARWLMEKGIKKQDIVAIYISNSPTFYELWFACGAIGAILLPINTASTASELDYFLEHSESKAFIYQEDLITDSHLQVAFKHNLLILEACCINWESEKMQQSEEALSIKVLPQEVASVMYTSGTTAKPKGVLITHENYLFAGHSSALYQSLNSSDRYLIFLPLFHANSQYYTSMAMLVTGGTIILLKKFSSSTFWESVQKYKPTVTSLVATVIKMLNNTSPNQYETDNTLRQAGYGLFVPQKDIREFEKRFNIRLFQWYGMTETLTTSIVTPLYEEMPIDPTTGILSIGKAALGVEVKIIDENDNLLPPGEVGQIIIKSPSIFKGYLKNPIATAETIQNGWIYTGDNGYYNEEGYIWFVDRHKDMIKRAGENISTIEIENIISEHPAVQECAVIGEPDMLREESVVAYIKLSNDQAATEQELKDFCKVHLSHFKVPQTFRFIDDFPRTSIGKIQKNKLKQS